MTRDPDRIEDILDELEEYWSENPDLRLGQIVCNISQKKGYEDSFYIEDEEVLRDLRNLNRTDE